MSDKSIETSSNQATSNNRSKINSNQTQLYNNAILSFIGVIILIFLSFSLFAIWMHIGNGTTVSATADAQAIEFLNQRISDLWSSVQSIGIVSGVIGVLITVVVLYFSLTNTALIKESKDELKDIQSQLSDNFDRKFAEKVADVQKRFDSFEEKLKDIENEFNSKMRDKSTEIEKKIETITANTLACSAQAEAIKLYLDMVVTRTGDEIDNIAKQKISDTKKQINEITPNTTKSDENNKGTSNGGNSVGSSGAKGIDNGDLSKVAEHSNKATEIEGAKR